jgi:hypothetical protein
MDGLNLSAGKLVDLRFTISRDGLDIFQALILDIATLSQSGTKRINERGLVCA